MIEIYFKHMGSHSINKKWKKVNISIEKTIQDLKEKVKKIFNANNEKQ